MKTRVINKDVERSAHISSDGCYRYTLARIWDHSKPKVMFIGLNPSVADGTIDDKTILKCQCLVENWNHVKFRSVDGYGGFIMDNLFAYRSTKPAGLRDAVDPIGPENNSQLIKDAEKCKLIILAWSCHGRYKGRARSVLRRLLTSPSIKSKLYFLRKTTNNMPYHPLGGRTSSTTIPIDIIPQQVEDDTFDGGACGSKASIVTVGNIPEPDSTIECYSKRDSSGTFESDFYSTANIENYSTFCPHLTHTIPSTYMIYPTHSVCPTRDTTPILSNYPRGNSTMISTIYPQGSSPILSNYPRGTSPVLSNYPRGTSPILSNYPRGTSPMLSNYPRGNNPILSNYPRGNSPILSNYPRGNSPILSNYPQGNGQLLSNYPSGTSQIQSNYPRLSYPNNVRGLSQMHDWARMHNLSHSTRQVSRTIHSMPGNHSSRLTYPTQIAHLTGVTNRILSDYPRQHPTYESGFSYDAICMHNLTHMRHSMMQMPDLSQSSRSPRLPLSTHVPSSTPTFPLLQIPQITHLPHFPFNIQVMPHRSQIPHSPQQSQMLQSSPQILSVNYREPEPEVATI